MAIITYEDAQRKYCPFYSQGSAGVTCMLNECMAWSNEYEYTEGQPVLTGRGECSLVSPFRAMKVLQEN